MLSLLLYRRILHHVISAFYVFIMLTELLCKQCNLYDADYIVIYYHSLISFLLYPDNVRQFTHTFHFSRTQLVYRIR